ncbi:MAG: hypothetical protein CMJ89_16625 [Planctomycetes bacterium]|jgi:predicted AlkP superfamily phosphohydrolase/phosphomutase|nr:hypothetical protein [Planctomycetota bacterium]
MILPRWTVYPALALLAGLIVVAIPKKSHGSPFAGAATIADLATETAATIVRRPTKFKPVVILGIDGLDPDELAKVIKEYPDRMQNFRWLVEQADGIQPLGTSNPPQSPVAWSNFITGLNPGGHGIFDFIHRDPMTRALTSSQTKIEEPFMTLGIPFTQYKFDIGGDAPANRSGKSFWTILAENGIPADIWRMPANFPVEPSQGVSFPGMMTPAVDSAYGLCSFWTTDGMRDVDLDYDKVQLIEEYSGRIDASLLGPPNPMKKKDARGHDIQERIAFKIYVDREAGAAAIDVGVEKVVLEPGQWSDFVRLDFQMLPMGSMSMSGICRFYLRSIDPEVELYASPVNFDPEAPAFPVSEPSSASEELVEGIGRYYTQGMAEDVNALKNDILSDAEFMQQVDLVYRERVDMLDYALDLYTENDDGGFLFFYFSTVDLCSHMMWRHTDGAHPAHDAEKAKEDSSWWSGREGSTWKDTVADLYMKMDPVLGRVRERLGDETTLIVMSDHGFAPFRYEFSLNTWLYENGYLVLKPGFDKELARDASGFKKQRIFTGAVDWSKTKAYGMGFNGLYLNLAGRELDNPETDEDESGIVQASEVDTLLGKIKVELESYVHKETGMRPILNCAFAKDIYSGPRMAEAPDMLVGYNAGYGNSDASSTGRIPHALIQENSPATHSGKLGTFNGNHLMAPEVVAGTLLSNKPVRAGAHRLEDLTVEILRQYGIERPEAMQGHPVLE